MINGETGYLSMDVKVPVDKGVRYYPSVQVTRERDGKWMLKNHEGCGFNTQHF